jgi:hypothetical protein
MLLRKLSSSFTGGLVGAFVDSFNIWILGVIGITGLLGVGMRPEFTPPWLYPRLVWGGLFGLLFALPVLEDRPVFKRNSLQLASFRADAFRRVAEYGERASGAWIWHPNASHRRRSQLYLGDRSSLLVQV